MDKLRQIIADITVATANASQRRSENSDSVESCRYDYDNVRSTPTTRVNTSDELATADMTASGRFVSNKSVTLSAATLPPTAPVAPPNTRTSMREMQDSNAYVLFTSAKDLPVGAPVTTNKRRPPTPAANVEQERKPIFYVAETVVEGSNSVEELNHTSLEHHLVPVESPRQQTATTGRHKSASGDSKLPSSQPLSFANPLFLYKVSSQASGGGCASSCKSSVMQKSCSLTSVAVSNNVGSPPAGGSRGAPAALDRSCSPGRKDVPRRRVSGGRQGWKPSYSNECLADGTSDVVQAQTRHSVILTADEPTTVPPGLSGSLSHSAELMVSCDAEQPKHGATASNVVGLDTPPDSPLCVSTCHGASGNRRIMPSPNNVRMGVRSMQRRPVEPEKSKIEARSLIYIFYYFQSVERAI